MKKIQFSRLKLGVAPVVLGVALISAPAFAQDAAADEAVSSEDTIIVTGSRIARPELDNTNPVVGITAMTIENSGQTNITDILLRNPALTASVGSSLAGGPDAGFGETGVNLLDLRNLGTERTLVLVNGKRHVAGIPNSAAVDINTIPQDLIERVDVLTGGASAIYGADGVSGVVNFILKRDFEGLTARAQAGLSSRGDAGSQLISVVAGKNFADGRGNVTAAYEYSKSKRLHSSRRGFSGNPDEYFSMVQNPDDFQPGDNPDLFDFIPQNNLTWAYSAPQGMVELDSGLFLGDGSAYDPGIVLPGTAFAIGGTNTPVAGYFGDLQPATQRHAYNLMGSFEFSPAARFYAEGKYVETKAFSVAQPSFEFGTALAGDNAYLIERFGAAAAAGGAGLYRDNFDLGIRGETNQRKTYRIVLGLEGELSDHLRYDMSYVYGRTTARYEQTSNLIGDRFFAALDAVYDPGSGQIVCRSTLDPSAAAGATTFTPGAGSTCRPLNLLGEGVADQAALDFVLADNISRSRISQEVFSGSISGDTGAFFNLPGGAVGFAVGAEYRREKSSENPDPLMVNGDFRDFAAIAPSGGKFNVKEVFAELNVPLLADMPFAERLSFGGAIRYSDYSTVGTTTTWKVDGLYAPIRDVRFRATYSQAVRAPNMGELFLPASGTFSRMTDPCDITRRDQGTQYRVANCEALLAGIGLTPAEIAAFSPNSVPEMNTTRRGQVSGNRDLREETAKTWTAGVVLQPSFIRGLTMTFDWYNIRIKGAINTPTATELAALCVDQATIDNIYCENVFRDQSTGYFLGGGNDPLQRNAFLSRPENVAGFRTAGADFTINYKFSPSDKLGQFELNMTAGYLDKISFVPTIGADVDNDILEAYNPRWRGSASVNWSLDNFSLNYGVSYWSKTRRFTTEQLAADPDISDPKYFWMKEKIEHDVRAAVKVSDAFQFYAGVNNLFDTKPEFGELSYPVSGVGRYVYAGVKVGL
ncbi:TonB-dependent receptor plug domain-containing protein [Sphingopyxis sp. R3-92]|uniref:TonB-dependent receptor plug domain-containing protein n=1 Tax=Sphingopyxis sp. R3-92 TaxID=3158553 RepID=UPI003EE72AA5